MSMILYHNPRCGKSRNALEILETEGAKFKVREYLKEKLSIEEILDLSQKLKLSVSEMIRTKEGIYAELRLAQKKLSDKELAKIIVEHPILLERPILVHKSKAVIARPPSRVEEIL